MEIRTANGVAFDSAQGTVTVDTCANNCIKMVYFVHISLREHLTRACYPFVLTAPCNDTHPKLPWHPTCNT
jgi:hypothetical protein